MSCRVVIAVALASLPLAACGGHRAPRRAPTRSASQVQRCLRAQGVTVSVVTATRPSLLYRPALGAVRVVEARREKAIVWIYPTAAVAKRMLTGALSDLLLIGEANVIVEYIGRRQPSPATERRVDRCAFPASGTPVASPLLDVYS